MLIFLFNVRIEKLDTHISVFLPSLSVVFIGSFFLAQLDCQGRRSWWAAASNILQLRLCLSLYLSSYLCIHLPICLSIYIPIYLFICPFVCLSFYLPAYLPTVPTLPYRTLPYLSLPSRTSPYLTLPT